MQFFNFTLRFGQVRWGLKVPLHPSEEIRRNTQAKTPSKNTPPFRLRATRLDLPFSDCWTDLIFLLDAFSH